MWFQEVWFVEKHTSTKVLLQNGWNSKQIITEGEVAIPLETTLHAFRNQEKTKQRSTIYRKRVFKAWLQKCVLQIDKTLVEIKWSFD